MYSSSSSCPFYLSFSLKAVPLPDVTNWILPPSFDCIFYIHFLLASTKHTETIHWRNLEATVSQSTAASNDPSPKPHASFDLHEAATKLLEFPCSPTRVGPMSFKSVDRQCSSPQAYVRSCTIVTDRRGAQLFVWTRHTIKCQWSKGSLCACDALTRRSVILVPLGEIPNQVWVITLCWWCFKNLCWSESFVQIEERRFNTRRHAYWTC